MVGNPEFRTPAESGCQYEQAAQIRQHAKSWWFLHVNKDYKIICTLNKQ